MYTSHSRYETSFTRSTEFDSPRRAVYSQALAVGDLVIKKTGRHAGDFARVRSISSDGTTITVKYCGTGAIGVDCFIESFRRPQWEIHPHEGILASPEIPMAEGRSAKADRVLSYRGLMREQAERQEEAKIRASWQQHQRTPPPQQQSPKSWWGF